MAIKTLTRGLAAAVLAFGVAGETEASLIGDEVTVELMMGEGAIVPVSAVVGPDVEFNFNDFVLIDFDADSILVSLGSPAPGFSATEWRFTDLDWIGGGSLSGVSVTGLQIPDFLLDISNTANSVTVSHIALVSDFVAGGFFRVDFDHGTSALPEPATFSLLGLSAAGLIFAARRRRKGS